MQPAPIELHDVTDFASIEDDPDDRADLEARLDAMGILPPEPWTLPTRTLERIDALFAAWDEARDDDERRDALSSVFADEAELRGALLPLVPIFYARLFFDERTPTRDLVQLLLVAHARRQWSRSR